MEYWHEITDEAFKAIQKDLAHAIWSWVRKHYKKPFWCNKPGSALPSCQELALRHVKDIRDCINLHCPYVDDTSEAVENIHNNQEADREYDKQLEINKTIEETDRLVEEADKIIDIPDPGRSIRG